MIIAHLFPVLFIAHVYIGWSRPIAQQIVSYCTHFNKNITERSIPQMEISLGGCFGRAEKCTAIHRQTEP